MTIIILIAPIYLIVLAFIMSAQNFRSQVLFNILPFFLGLALLIIAADMSGWITIAPKLTNWLAWMGRPS